MMWVQAPKSSSKWVGVSIGYSLTRSCMDMNMNVAAPRCEVAYVSVRNQAERSSNRTLHKCMYTSKRSFKGCNVVKLMV